MAFVYYVNIGKFTDKEKSGMEVYSRIMLIDAAGDQDDWVTDSSTGANGVIGEGSGDWMRRASTKSIVLTNNQLNSIEAVLTYESWPLRSEQSGRVVLTKPLKGARNDDEKKLYLDFWVRDVR